MARQRKKVSANRRHPTADSLCLKRGRPQRKEALERERATVDGVQRRLGDFPADERKVKQILLNLLSNAVKFTPDGGRVDLSATMDTDKVEIAVKDR